MTTNTHFDLSVVSYTDDLYLFCCVCVPELVFPTTELSMSGFALHVDSSLLHFLHYLSLHHTSTSTHPSSTAGPHTTDPLRGEGEGEERGATVQAVAPLLPYTLTPTASVMEQSWGEAESATENKILSILKLYAMKVQNSNVCCFRAICLTEGVQCRNGSEAWWDLLLYEGATKGLGVIDSVGQSLRQTPCPQRRNNNIIMMLRTSDYLIRLLSAILAIVSF